MNHIRNFSDLWRLQACDQGEAGTQPGATVRGVQDLEESASLHCGTGFIDKSVLKACSVQFRNRPVFPFDLKITCFALDESGGTDRLINPGTDLPASLRLQCKPGKYVKWQFPNRRRDQKQSESEGVTLRCGFRNGTAEALRAMRELFRSCAAKEAVFRL